MICDKNNKTFGGILLMPLNTLKNFFHKMFYYIFCAHEKLYLYNFKICFTKLFFSQ